MSRYKGRTSTRAIERDFPHIVEMVVPPNGLGRRLDAMHDYLTARGVPSRFGRGRREGDQDIIRWCFDDAGIAAAFAAEFGGVQSKIIIEQ